MQDGAPRPALTQHGRAGRGRCRRVGKGGDDLGAELPPTPGVRTVHFPPLRGASETVGGQLALRLGCGWTCAEPLSSPAPAAPATQAKPHAGIP